MKRAFTAATLAIVTAAGCASTPEVSPNQEAIVEASDELHLSTEAGAVAANEQPPYRVMLRHNPSRCPCPEFEILVFGAWERVWLEGTDAALARVDSFKESGTQRTMPIEGTLTSERRPSERQVTYPVFEIE